MNQQATHLLAIDTLWTARPECPSELQINSGRAWVTMTGTLDKTNPDYVLSTGDTLSVPAGQHLVVETWPRHPGDTLTVFWQAAASDPTHKHEAAPAQVLS